MSDLGRVKSLRYNKSTEHRILAPALTKRGYLMLVLCKDGKKKGLHLHRLVANTFIPNIELKSQVNHINGIKTDNRVCNLEWVTPKENTNKAYEIGLKKTGKYLYNTRWIYQFDLNMKYIKKWESITQASKGLGISQGDISKCCAGKRNKCGNYIWLNDEGLLNELERLKKYEDLEWQEFNELSVVSKELEKKDKVINEMAKQLVKAHGWFYSEFDNFTEKEFIEYFTNKAENVGE